MRSTARAHNPARLRLRYSCVVLMATCVLAAGRAYAAEEEEIEEASSARAGKSEKNEAKEHAGHAYSGAAEVRAGAGYMRGWSTIKKSAALVLVEAEAKAKLDSRTWRLQFPLTASHRQTFLGSLPESRLQGAVEGQLRRFKAVRLDAALGAKGVLRQGWIDLYQPKTTGGYEHTGRYSYFEWFFSLGAVAKPARGQRVELDYRFRPTDYRDDPAFNANADPNHLVPGDRSEHLLTVSWRLREKPYTLEVYSEARWRYYEHAFSRDALTGKTHAGPGGPPPNPLYSQRTLEPGMKAAMDFGREVNLEVRYGFESSADLYQGYYSSSAHKPELRMHWRRRHALFDAPVELFAKAAYEARSYGPNSYAPGPGHPALLFGDHRTEQRYGLGVDIKQGIAKPWSMFASADLLVRRSNFPPYEAGVFPASKQYNIDWNYENWMLVAGVEYDLEWGD